MKNYMAYICYKPLDSCKTCEHFRYDVDKNSMICFALFDGQNEKNNQEENNENKSTITN